MNALDFVVVVDTMPAEVTGYADVVLPENTYLERYDDLETTPFRVPYVAVRQPVVAVALRQQARLVDRQDPRREAGAGRATSPGRTRRTTCPPGWRRRTSPGSSLKKDGVIVGPAAPIYEDGPLTLKTPSKKVEFFSQTLADAGLAPMPEYEPPEEPPTGYFRLLFGRSPVHTFTPHHQQPPAAARSSPRTSCG